MKLKLLLILCAIFPVLAHGQTVCSLESRERLEGFLDDIQGLDRADGNMNELVIEIGKWFLNTPYVEKTLELPGEEQLVINLTGLDCTTYLETVVTLARLAKMGKFGFSDYERQLEYLRYANGRRDAYPSRLHYFSDWLRQNQEKGILKDVSAEIGGEVYPNKPSFMSSNPQFYAQLDNSDYVAQIKASELAIAGHTYHYIPKARISELESRIEPGDLIAITASMNSLDIVHVGFAVEKNGRIHLLHAGTKNMKVEISEMPLHDYLKANKSQSGIMVARLYSPQTIQ